ncbi:small RNA 2'-O-methyltransferase [Cryptomeria japonica]|uniref:small RNA 2'-O-methyltransferase n=1 Tax=Cryptomeria japonica TaxID=3369 RepID=UPI0027DA058F|nr:small RNA 2'-O-methyltransferase [Cryptomeria japonica]XP_057830307.2 small RNA 2'-O-methyltransferase [Cryptomeria japonica]XP_057830308.2 small RNA 2'-O-methyltransferase [Cryptomeria japonica]XP_057830309.2 small RNA 2'-O-methyltransferase [Cryptomeria japonica]
MSTNTPKATIFNKYGQKACYKTEIVPAEPAEDTPRLLVSQTRQNKYICRLELPDFSVTSGPFIKKKDAEQDAAKLALDKLGLQLATVKKPHTEEEKWQALKDRLCSTFSEQLIQSHCPLIAHFKAAVQRQGKMYGLVPAAVLSAFDNRIVNLCKSIDSKAETDPALSLAIVLKAVKSCNHLDSHLDHLWLGKEEFFPLEIKEKLVNWTPESSGKTGGTIEYRERTESLFLETVFIPCSSEMPVESLTLKIEPQEYFVDVIAQHLRVRDSSHILISRILKKAPLESRLYFPVPDSIPAVTDLNGISSISDIRVEAPLRQSKFNTRASSLVSQKIHGDAILAAVGSTWRSFGTLSWENINLSNYCRILLSRTPRGNYKLSRDSVLVAELPTTFTTRSRWHGALPRGLLIECCNHYCLSEPEFFLSVDDTPLADSKEKVQNSEHTKQSEFWDSNSIEKKAEMVKGTKCEKNGTINETQNVESDKDLMGRGRFICVVKISSKTGELIIECASEQFYRNRTDAIQSAALKALNHKYFSAANVLAATLKNDDFTREISDHVFAGGLNKKPASRDLPIVASCISDNVLSTHEGSSENSKTSFSTHSKFLQKDEMDFDYYNEMTHLKTGCPSSGKPPTSGTTACISYRVDLLNESARECLECREEFDFEIGTGAVISRLEECVASISVNESKCFCMPLPSKDEILAAAGDIAGKISHLGASHLEYNVELLRLIEPMEERMEQALFSPPLSKQRMEYALRLLSDNDAKCLVDLGCGSGSLFDALLDQKTDLVHIVGVDISEKSLCRAAKVLNSKLGMNHNSSTASFQSASVYYGSITEPDQRICGFDVATCIEVIEHMEEDQAFKFGECALGSLCPRILMVSTPNVEYNPILQRNVSDVKNDGEGEESMLDAEGKGDLPCRFRNDDHKFEWTRKQFSDWALNLASQHGYSVEFSGVGGSGEIEPGFASQIAVFKRLPAYEAIHVNNYRSCNEGYNESNISGPYKEVWKWRAG